MTEFLPSRPSLAHSTLLLLILHSSGNDDETADLYWGPQKVFAKTNSAYKAWWETSDRMEYDDLT